LNWEVQKNFVRTVRAVEWLIGVEIPGCQALEGMGSITDLYKSLAEACTRDTLGLFTPPVVEALKESVPMLLSIIPELGWDGDVDFTACQGRSPITTKLVFPFSLSRRGVDWARF